MVWLAVICLMLRPTANECLYNFGSAFEHKESIHETICSRLSPLGSGIQIGCQNLNWSHYGVCGRSDSI